MTGISQNSNSLVCVAINSPLHPRIMRLLIAEFNARGGTPYKTSVNAVRAEFGLEPVDGGDEAFETHVLYVPAQREAEFRLAVERAINFSSGVLHPVH